MPRGWVSFTSQKQGLHFSFREGLNVGTVPTFKMHNLRTVLTFKMHNIGTVPTFKMHNVGTVPTNKTHNIGTELSYATLRTKTQK